MNRGHDYEETVGTEGHGRTVLDYLADRYPHSGRAAWADRISSGRVRVDGGRASGDTPLRSGQSLVWRRPPWEEPDAPRSFAVLFRDEDVLAVAKPAGLPTLPGGGFLENTLLMRVRAHDGKASPLHRLGRFTSGIALFARNPRAGAHLSRQFAERTVTKRYRALASGSPPGDRFEVDVPIGPVPHRILGRVHGANPAGRPARSRVRVIERGKDRFLCDVWIETGRPHQIRIHLAAVGHPLVGDPLYPPGGVPDPFTKTVPGEPGYRLHAAEISFLHPRTGRPVSLSCACPMPLREL